MNSTDFALEALLDLNGYEYRFGAGYRVKFEVRRTDATRGRPHGIKYSLTLHDPVGRRIFGMDNAHAAKGRAAFDHRHLYGARKVVAYDYRGPVALLEDFYREVERIVKERGVR
jgi:hypothetical protein